MCQHSRESRLITESVVYSIVLWVLLTVSVSADVVPLGRIGLSAREPAPKDFGDFEAYLASSTKTDRQGRAYASHLWLFSPLSSLPDPNSPKGVRPFKSVVHFPTLYEGDIVPLFGKLYRIDRINTGGRGSIEFEPMDDPDLPKRVAVQDAESYFIPQQRNTDGYLEMDRMTVTLESITLPEKEGEPLVATVGLEPQVVNSKVTSVKVKTGDLLKIGEYFHKVRHIVPPDEKRQILGWVEIAPLPAKDANGNLITRQPELSK